MINQVDILLPHGGGIQTPDTIVAHAMAEYIRLSEAGSRQLASNGIKIKPGIYHAAVWLHLLGLSAHALIAPGGVCIRQRRDDQIAWHARRFNTNSLGIEFLVPGTYDYAEFVQRIKTAYLTQDQIHCGQEKISEWVDTWTIKTFTTHHRLDPTRKPDPGDGFPENEFNQGI